MNYKDFFCQLPIKDNNVKVISGLVAGDTANIVHLRLMDGETPLDFTGYTQVVLSILKPDGTRVHAMVTDSDIVESDNNPYCLQVVEPENGRISFTLSGQATVLTGTHFAQIQVFGNAKRLTSARINYYVGESLDEDNLDITSQSNYASLQEAINTCAALTSMVVDMYNTEDLRSYNEEQRQLLFAEAMAELNSYLQNAMEYIEECRLCMESASNSAENAKNPTIEAIRSILEDMQQGDEFASLSAVYAAIAEAIRNFDAGEYNDDAESVKKLILRNGLEEDLPDLDIGELGFSTDTKQVYVGASSGNVPIGGVYMAQETEPQRRDLLWIDTSASGGNSIKFYDASTSSWKPTSTVNFA